MKVFISWSGVRSRETAKVLNVWLKKLVPELSIFVSTEMEVGIKWLEKLNQELETNSFGILCLNRENEHAPWLNFEAGAISRAVDQSDARVIPYLMDFSSEGDLANPLAQFNACLANEDGTYRLLKTINEHCQHPQSLGNLRESFELRWQSLEHQLIDIRDEDMNSGAVKRSDSEKLDEILSYLRQNSSLMGTPTVTLRQPKGLSGSGLLNTNAARIGGEFGQTIDQHNADELTKRFVRSEGINPETYKVRVTDKAVFIVGDPALKPSMPQASRLVGQLAHEFPSYSFSVEIG